MLRTRFLPAACRSIALLLSTSLIASPAFSQATKPVCLSVAQAAKVADSLAVLPLVRQEAALWRAATDSLRTADAAHYRAFQSVRGALQDQRLVTANETAKAEAWRGRARKRGLLNYLLLALAGGVGYLTIK